MWNQKSVWNFKYPGLTPIFSFGNWMQNRPLDSHLNPYSMRFIYIAGQNSEDSWVELKKEIV